MESIFTKTFETINVTELLKKSVSHQDVSNDRNLSKFNNNRPDLKKIKAKNKKDDNT